MRDLANLEAALDSLCDYSAIMSTENDASPLADRVVTWARELTAVVRRQQSLLNSLAAINAEKF